MQARVLADPDLLAQAIRQVALDLPDYRGQTRSQIPEAWDSHKVYVADLWRALSRKGMDEISLDEFKAALLAHNPDKRWLGRVDMPVNLAKDKASTITHGNATFQTINTTPLLRSEGLIS